MAIRRPSLWGSSTPSPRHGSLGSTSLSGSELNLRDEFDEFVYGANGKIKHGHLVLIRHMRRDANGAPDYCECMIDKITLECDPDCSYCGGEGYLWDEAWHLCYSMYGGSDSGFLRRQVWMPSGGIRVDYKIFFVRYDTDIQYGDKVVEVVLDVEGDPVLPYVRESIHKPQTINKFRSDHGRIEYIAIYCREEDAIRSDTPQ